jgi:hypothetical protein
MDEVAFGNLLKNISLAVGILGVVVGLDLILGAKVIIYLKKILDRSTDIVDKTIINAHSKRTFGFAILFLSLLILFLCKNIRM